MTVWLARALMAVAERCTGESRRDWMFAMQGELESTIEDGKHLTFATGCLIAAWREIPRHNEGRLLVANYALALGLFIPIAALQFSCAANLAFPNIAHTYAMFGPASMANPYLAEAYLNAIPCLLGLQLLLCVLHFRLAWVLLDTDWSRAMRVGLLIAAGTVTLIAFSSILLLDNDQTFLQAGIVAIELVAGSVSARLHTRLFQDISGSNPSS